MTTVETPHTSLGVPFTPAFDLPVHLTGFIGRDRELSELHALLPAARLLTLTGAGGSGKTRLAREFAARGRWRIRTRRLGRSRADRTGDPRRPADGNRAAHSRDARRERDRLARSKRSAPRLRVDRHRQLRARGRRRGIDCRSAASRVSALTVLATSREALGVAERDGVARAAAGDHGSHAALRRARAARAADVRRIRRESARRSARSVVGSTEFRWRSSSPRRASACCRPSRSRAVSTTRSIFSLLEVAPRCRVTAPSARRWSGVIALLRAREQVLLRRLSVFAGQLHPRCRRVRVCRRPARGRRHSRRRDRAGGQVARRDGGGRRRRALSVARDRPPVRAPSVSMKWARRRPSHGVSPTHCIAIVERVAPFIVGARAIARSIERGERGARQHLRALQWAVRRSVAGRADASVRRRARMVLVCDRTVPRDAPVLGSRTRARRDRRRSAHCRTRVSGERADGVLSGRERCARSMTFSKRSRLLREHETTRSAWARRFRSTAPRCLLAGEVEAIDRHPRRGRRVSFAIRRRATSANLRAASGVARRVRRGRCEFRGRFVDECSRSVASSASDDDRALVTVGALIEFARDNLEEACALVLEGSRSKWRATTGGESRSRSTSSRTSRRGATSRGLRCAHRRRRGAPEAHGRRIARLGAARARGAFRSAALDTRSRFQRDLCGRTARRRPTRR